MNFEFNKDREKLEFQPTTEEEVKKLLLKISNAKATGQDGIPVRFLKDHIELSARIITHIINLSLRTLIVPEAWKAAQISPLYKEGDPTNASNYRPIAILPCVSKILERIVHQQVYAYLNKWQILSKAQFGFRKAHSTTTCVLSLLNYIYSNIDNGKLVGVVFLDLKKAFDTVDHNVFLKKLNKYGLTEQSIAWFRNYLSEHYQVTKVMGPISSPLLNTCGVPQGSILCPLLFILYINDLIDCLGVARIGLYADDTALFLQVTVLLN